ncbi:MAG: hypothetical protein ACRDL7_07640, partial [Gaiellaceae bacterium]
YNITLDAAIRNQVCYQPLIDVLHHVGGRERAYALLNALDKAAPNKHFGLTWDAPYSTDQDLNKLMNIVSRTCSNNIFKAGITDICH